ncbi:aminoacyl-tRNA hydrolase [Nitrospira sp. Kam-Ns4a]
MRLIVGLGNPGERYLRTRHNVGRQVVERAAARWSVRLRPGGPAHRGVGQVGPPDAKQDITLAVPLTWMNDSGSAVKTLLEDLGLPPEQLLVVHDDLDLPVGRLRVKARGGAGGHNGLLSIIAALDTDAFCRLKIGIGRPAPGQDPADYVLSPFAPEEQAVIEPVEEQAVAALECWIVEGVAAAMNRFNQKPMANSE